MNKKLLFLSAAVILVLAGAGCGAKGTPAGENENKNLNQNVNVNNASQENTNSAAPIVSVPAGEEEASGNVALVAYINKSLGYKMMRPDKWYWQHLIQKEIGDAVPGVKDLFVTDPKPLPPLGSEYLGRIAIEVSGKSLDELEKNFSDLSSSDATVGGIAAKKFEGTRTIGTTSEKVIAYFLEKDGASYEIVYTKPDSTAEDEEVFQNMINSFSF